jgi:hypothetical protein
MTTNASIQIGSNKLSVIYVSPIRELPHEPTHSGSRDGSRFNEGECTQGGGHGSFLVVVIGH